MTQLSPWIKVTAGNYAEMARVREAVGRLGVYTVCEEAKCPNVFSCWGRGTATFMILGDTCTKSCRFCAVKTGNPRGYVDPTEPARVAEAVARLGLKYVVVTSVDRDDLPDGGASQFAKTVRAIKERAPGAYVEVLTPDFGGRRESIALVAEAGPHVFAHNLETVRRLTPVVRDRRASYEVSLSVLKAAKELGEVLQALDDLRRAEVDIVTVGQYIKPGRSPRFLEVRRWATPEEFEKSQRRRAPWGSRPWWRAPW